jgi:hypothetical protein
MAKYIIKNQFYAHRIDFASCISETKHALCLVCLPHVNLSFHCTVVIDNMFPSALTMNYTDIMDSLATNVLVSFFWGNSEVFICRSRL